MIKAITFDLDGVYFVNGKSNFIANVRKLGVPEKEVKRVFLESDQMNKLYKQGKLNDYEFWTWAVREWKLEKPPKEVVRLLIEGYQIDKKVNDVVKKLGENGYKTLICSNNFPARVNGLQEKFRFLDNFYAWAMSYAVGITKPAEKMFVELISKSGVKAEEIVFADDHPENIKAAKKLGIKAFYYEGFDQFLEKLKKLGVKI